MKEVELNIRNGSSILGRLRASLLEKSAGLSAERFVIRGIWEFSMGCQPRPAERLFTEAGCLVGTFGIGASFRTAAAPALVCNELIGQDGREVETDDLALQVAVLDSCYSSILQTPAHEYTLAGNTMVKASERARIVAEEVHRIAQRYHIAGAKVLMVGFVNSIVEELHRLNLPVICSDFDSSAVGSLTYNGSLVCHGSLNADLVKNSNIILLTGLTLTSRTLDDLLAIAKLYEKPVAIFAQTGSNFATEYIDMGVTTVISERYPWYSIPGQSVIRVFRAF